MKGKVWGAFVSNKKIERLVCWSTYDQGQRASAFGVNQEQGGNGEDNLNGTIAKRGI